MNERIIDLYEQASSFASEEENPTKSYKDRVMLKFAELIVFECIKIAVFKGDTTTGKAIKEHFGVKV